MNFPSFLFVVGAGYVCGLSVSSGLLLRAVFVSHVKGAKAWRAVAWLFLLFLNTVMAGMTAIFLAVIAVSEEEVVQGPLLVRAVLFLVGLVVAASFVFISAHLIDVRLRELGVDLFGVGK